MTKIPVDDALARKARVYADGVQGEFWRLMKGELEKLSSDAMSQLADLDPTDVSGISQRQMIVKVARQFIGTVENTAALSKDIQSR